MGTGAPTPAVIPVHAAPKKAPCPTCGKHGRRKRTFTRRVRTVAYKAVAYLEITCGESQAKCGCRKTFRNSPQGVLPRALYDSKVRDLVLDRILKDGMSVERTLESLGREYLLDLSTGFVYDLLHDHARQLDMSEHRRTILELFSGTLCLDELHLGRFTLLLATDPTADVPVAFARVDRNDRDHMRRFLKNLKDWGLNPEVVVTDGSNLYPAVLTELWPDADHQRCVFHYRHEAALPVYEADRHAKVQLKKKVRGVRPIERQVEGRDDPEAEAVRGSCAAVRSALTDDGRPTREASGLKLRDRLEKVAASLDRAAARAQRGSRRS